MALWRGNRTLRRPSLTGRSVSLGLFSGPKSCCFLFSGPLRCTWASVFCHCGPHCPSRHVVLPWWAVLPQICQSRVPRGCSIRSSATVRRMQHALLRAVSALTTASMLSSFLLLDRTLRRNKLTGSRMVSGLQCSPHCFWACDEASRGVELFTCSQGDRRRRRE